MSQTRIVSEFGKKYECTSFTNVDPDYSGVTVKSSGNIIGEIVGLDIPDKYDKIAITKFNDKVTTWLVENE